jgi:hypothetical protein
MATNWTMVDTGKQAVLNSKTGYTGSGADLPKNWQLRLFKAYTVRTNPRDQIIGDFTEATFTGYLPVALAPWGVALYDATNFWWYSLSALCSFFNTGATSQTILGYYMTDGGATVLYGFGVYATPVVLLPTQVQVEQIQLDELSQYNN